MHCQIKVNKEQTALKIQCGQTGRNHCQKIAAFSPSVNSDNDTDAVTSDGRPFEIGCGSHKYSVIDREMLGHWSNQ